jgi:YD repeat-containing protein
MSRIGWADSRGTGTLMRIPHSTKAPLEGRVWYEYLGQSPDGTTPPTESYIGTSSKPIKVGRVLDDNTTQLRQFVHNGLGQVEQSVDPIGRTTKYSYDSEGRLTAIKQVENGTDKVLKTFATFHPSRNPQEVTDAAGRKTDFVYNDDGNVLEVKKKRIVDGVLTEEKWTNTYYPDTAPVGSKRRLHTVSGPGGVLLKTYTYDSWGRVRTVTDSDAYVITATYDAFDRPLTVLYPDGTYMQAIYNKLNAEWVRDVQGRWTRTEHDSVQRVEAVTDPAGCKTQYGWCECGALESITDAKNQTTFFLYDVQGRPTDKVYPDNTNVKYAYETRTSRIRQIRQPRTNALTIVTNFEYYNDDCLKRIFYKDQNGADLPLIRADVNQPVVWTYDPFFHRVKTMTDGTGITTYNYVPMDPLDPKLGDGSLDNTVFKETTGGPTLWTIGYAYDEYGRVKTQDIDAANHSEWIFDSLGRIKKETNPLGAFNYTYDGQSERLMEVNNGQGYRSAFEYYPNVPAVAGTGNGDRRLKTINHFRINTTLSAQHEFAYTPAGSVTQWLQRWASLSEGARYVLRHDASEQLIGATRHNAITSELEREDVWSYDRAGNRELNQASVRIGPNSYNVEANPGYLQQWFEPTGEPDWRNKRTDGAVRRHGR